MAISMKNKSSKHVYGSSFSTFGLKYLLCIYCLMLLPFDLLTFVTGTVSANSDELVEYKFPQDSLTASNDANDPLKRKLWRSDITPAKDEKDPKIGIELNRLIEQVRSIEFTSQQPSETVVVPETVSTTEPNEASVSMTVPNEDETKEIESKPPYTSITDKTLQMLKSLTLSPEKIDNPFELGEILFLNGNLKEAAVFHQEALIRTDPNDPESAIDRAWLLFQKGNCLRDDDVAMAAKIYGQLIMEYPNSLWAEFAQIQSQIIAWYQTDEPQKLIAENEK